MSMVERVARAIADPILKEFDGFRLDKEVEWDKLPEARDQATLLRIARAAIEAMREPPAAVWIAMMNTKDDGTGELHFRKWKAAITAALGEGE